ncbi:D-alanine aminotransferase [Nitrospira sp.]|nr:D-alanine aminotransferase [Nitrospira sp.]
MPELAYLNSRFLPLSEATVSIDDRGFQFGDGVYEVVRTYRGRPFELPAHMQRLEFSAHSIHLSLPVDLLDLTRVVEEGIRLSGFQEAKIYIQLTRGVAPRDHAFPIGRKPTLVMTFREIHPLAQELRAKGVRVVTTEDPRWSRCDIKSLNLLGNVLARQQALEAGAFESLFVRNGVVTEGSVSNVMAIRRGALFTAPTGPAILAGVTRQSVLSMARDAGITVREEALTVPDFCSSEEVFLTGTTIEILPVVRINEILIGSGTPGPITTKLAGLFHAATRG